MSYSAPAFFFLASFPALCVHAYFRSINKKKQKSKYDIRKDKKTDKEKEEQDFEWSYHRRLMFRPDIEGL